MTEYTRFFETKDFDDFLLRFLTFAPGDYLLVEFIKSIHRNDETRIHKLLSVPNVVFEKSCIHETLLHLAVRFGSVDLVDRLIKLGAVVNMKTIYGVTPCYLATVRSAEMVQLLLVNGADVDIKERKNVSVLQRALLSGSVEVVMILVDKLFNRKQKSNERGSLMNNFAKFEESVLYLSESNINLDSGKYKTLLHFVTKYGDKEIFKIVLGRSKDFDINAKSPDGYALLHVAVDAGKIDLVREILKLGACVHLVCNQGYTALHYAIMGNNLAMVRLLIDHKADIHHKDDSTNAPLLLAMRLGYKKIIALLLDAGVDINMEMKVEHGSSTLIHDACGSNHLDGKYPEQYGLNYLKVEDWINWAGSSLEMIKFLIEVGADVDAKNSKGASLILSACGAGRLDIVKYLIDLGAKLDAEDSSGNDALCYAVRGNTFDLIQFLLCNGFDIRNKKKETLLLLSLFHCRHDYFPNMAEFLVDNGLDINAACPQKNWDDILFTIYQREPELIVGLLELKFDFKVQMKMNKDRSFLFPCRRKIVFSDSMMELTAFLALKGDDLFFYTNCFNIDGYVHMEKEIFCWKCEIDIVEMKRRRIYEGRRISYFDFLNKELLDVLPFSNCEELMQVLEAGTYKELFPCYAFLLDQRIKRVKKLRIYVELINNFLQKDYFKQTLPDVVLRHIFSFWNVGDIRNFGRALSVSNDILVLGFEGRRHLTL